MIKIQWKNLCNLIFVLWFLSENLFQHSTFSKVMTLLFALAVMMQVFRAFRIDRWTITYIVFAGVCYLNILLGYSMDVSRSMDYMQTLLFNIVFLAVAFQYGRFNGIENLKKMFIMSAVLLSLGLLAYAIIRTGSFDVRNLRYSDDMNLNALATYDAFSFCWLLSEKIKTENQKIKKFLLFSFVVLAFFILMSGTRKALLAIVIGTAIYYCLKNPSKLMKNILIVVALFVGSYFAIMNIPALYYAIGIRIESLFTMFNGIGDDSSLTRVHLLQIGIEYFKQSPIWGNGIHCFNLISGSGYYAHNNYIELLFSVGIVGTVVYYSFFVSAIFKSIKGYVRNHSYNFVMATTLLIVCLFIDIAMVSYIERCNILMITICELLLYENEREELA